MMSQEESKPDLFKMDYSEQLNAYAKGMLVSILWSGMGWLEPETDPKQTVNDQSHPETRSERLSDTSE